MKNTALTILGLLLVAGMGVGGYYLGWYMDKQAAAKQAEEITERSKLPKTYENKTLGIKFTYPGTWSITPEADIEKDKLVIVQKDNGTTFEFSKSDAKGNVIDTCDEAKPDGDGTIIKKCTFIKGTKFTFGRFVDSDRDNDDKGTFYGVAEPADQAEFKRYAYQSADGFYYYAKETADLTELDNIMKSVERLQ